MLKKRRLVPLHQPAAQAGHNQPPFDWKLNPNVVHREVGTVLGCVPPNVRPIHTLKEHAPDCDWLDYVTPNASTWKAKHETRDQFREKDDMRCRPVDIVAQHSAKLMEQMSWAKAMWDAGRFKGDYAYQEFTKYFFATTILPRPWWDSQIAIKIG